MEIDVWRVLCKFIVLLSLQPVMQSPEPLDLYSISLCLLVSVCLVHITVYDCMLIYTLEQGTFMGAIHTLIAIILRHLWV